MPVTQPEIGEVIDTVSSRAWLASGGPSRLLAKTATLEVRRLMLSKGREIPTHQAPGRDHGPLPGGADRLHRRRDDASPGSRPDDRPGRRRAAFGRRPGRLDRARHQRSSPPAVAPWRWWPTEESERASREEPDGPDQALRSRARRRAPLGGVSDRRRPDGPGARRAARDQVGSGRDARPAALVRARGLRLGRDADQRRQRAWPARRWSDRSQGERSRSSRSSACR